MARISQSDAIILRTDSPESFRAAVLRATELLRAGHVVAVPTETVYGLAANAFDAQAVNRIFKIKGRPAHNPIIVHVSSVSMAKRCVSSWPLLAGKLARAFWPGPLTLVLPRSNSIPEIVTAGGPTVGVRWPSHPFMHSLIRECGFPLAAPSANLSNRVSPTNAEHVRKALGNKISLIIDGGQAQVGIESTVLDLSVSPPQVLRPGMIRGSTLRAATGRLGVEEQRGQMPKSPGMLRQHYAPRARLVIWFWHTEEELRQRSAAFGVNPRSVHVIAHDRIPSGQGFGRVSVIPHDAEAFARSIYAELHQCDESGAELIIIEQLPQTDEWKAITDRLNRAAAAG
ncbi:MAG TPA: L-threonylcarbamoyladenylate synthase [Candidatus Limnocylindrales bacterium]|nr:L-threonylcarbamoyladenylate synthase [Candidatus Limnocylindrales bacterium]